jgi:hypothetical protein
MDCVREVEKEGLCYRHYLRTIGFNKGHLVNRLHPGLTLKESVTKIHEDAAKAGMTISPAE